MTWSIIHHALAYGVTVLATYYLASLLQTLFHRLFGHHELRGLRFRGHVEEHHANYVKEHMTSERYIAEERNGTYMYVIPFVLVVTGAYLTLPGRLFIVHAITLAASFYAIAHVHVQYHVKGSWLNRFAWFQRRRALHFIHHRHMGTNFAVIDYFWDRLFGTFRERDRSLGSGRDAQTSTETASRDCVGDSAK